MKDCRVFLLSIFLITSFSVSGQKISARAEFMSDSLKIGEPMAFFFSVRYPSDLTVLFPDSTYNFSPFEFQSKRYFATKTSNGQSLDSAVYYLSTFEIDPVQTLQLPAFVVNAGDCTSVFSNRDTVRLIELVPHPLDSVSADKLPLKETLAYQKVFFGLNYPLYLIIGGVLLVAGIIVLVVFGGRIRKHYRIKRLQKNHLLFQQNFSGATQKLQAAFSVPQTESTLVVWKKYMEQLESKPYTKLTTREMLMLEQDEQLGKNLKTIDRALYGHNTSVIESLEVLKGFADQRFHQKLEEVKHAK